jgi:N-acetylglucosaminyl-diphospho-decaprenol L-rhamnosyltransferase
VGLLTASGTMHLAYIIVAYRSAAHLRDCLDSIVRDQVADSQVIVVDNASPDGSARIAGAHDVSAQVVVSKVNRGFGAGCNLGASVSAAEYLWFVNPDARLAPEAGARLLARLEGDRGLGAAGPSVVDPTAQSRAVQAGAEPGVRSVLGHFLLLGRLPGLRRLFPPVFLARGDVATEPDWVSGAAMMVRRSAFEAVAGFDERLFLYMEDVDICRRMREAGWRIAYEPDARVYHAMGGSQTAGQATRWYRAFHDYVAGRKGQSAAVLCSLVAAAGLGLRAALTWRSRPGNARRVAEAAQAALACALTREPPVGG